MKNLRIVVVLVVASIVAGLPAHAEVPLINTFGGPLGFGTNCLPPNDDESSSSIDLAPAFPTGLQFFDRSHTTTFVNTNGNITFSNALGQFTPQAFPVANQPMIAPYWADVDIRRPDDPNVGSRVCNNPSEDGVWWSLSAGQMVVTWNNVGYFAEHTDHRMNFQLLLTVPPASQPGDFDVEFRYNRCEWTTGDASSGTNGFGGIPAQAGFDAGNSHDFLALPGSMTMNILNVCRTSNVGEPGRWLFEVRHGVVTACDPSTGTCSSSLMPDVDACVGWQCHGVDPLRIEGRAGPIGSCECAVPTAASPVRRNTNVGFWTALAGLVFVASARRRRQ